ncbi:lysophospholipid acyltransferase family protein [Streptomyces sp. WZ-12]|uniref:lysophospholipid acyltransferase family protein n=1 Tax=Streptomyces sp. WZ-12 TaxID=3030210 RepID=UPI0023817C42|nr:lysophospholipid acyltransferase family protein [Streptomyces sp. WZ-12]
MLYAFVRAVLLVPLFRWLFRLRVEGMEHIPQTGPAVIAGNHLSFCDQFLTVTVTRRKITYLCKKEYFTGRGLKGALTRGFFRGCGQIPVDRSGKEAGQAGVEAGLRVLHSGELLGIFPEGTRSHDGRMYKGKVGVAMMALESGAPVIPCAVIGTFEAQPAGRRLPRPAPLTIRFGTPLDFSRYAGMEESREVLRAVTDQIMYAIMKLSEQEYIDRYAAEAKAEATSGATTGATTGVTTGAHAQGTAAREGDPTKAPRRPVAANQSN